MAAFTGPPKRATTRVETFHRTTIAPRALACLLLVSLLLSEHPAIAAGAAAADANDDSGSSGSEARTYRFAHKTIIVPDDEKVHRGGEEAASTIDDVLVVADGVGGWANQGVDPGLYSRALVKAITTSYAAMSDAERATVDLKRLVHRSNYAAADAHLGSATCTVVRLKDATTLETVNVGDSSYSIHRRGEGGRLEVAYASVPGQKGFNYPYQLGGRHGDGVYEPNVTDGPRTHALEAGDVVVLVSDGVNDNMDPEDYHGCIEKYQWGNVPDGPAKAAFLGQRGGSPPSDAEIVSHSAVADCIARTAYHLAEDEEFLSPFARSAASYGKRWMGGKKDDITVAVAQVEVAGAAGDGALVPPRGDPHRAESIFLYGEDDFPVPGADALPSPEELLRKLAPGDGSEDGEGDSSGDGPGRRRPALGALRARARRWASKVGSILRRRGKRGGKAAKDPVKGEL